MAITLNEERIKITMTFAHPTATKAQIANSLLNTTLPKIVTTIQNKLQANFTDFVVGERRFDLRANPDHVNGWTATGRTVISGTTELTKQQLINGYDNTLDDIQDDIRADIVASGGIVISWHIHHYDQPVDELEA